jgi:hypothetical protein
MHRNRLWGGRSHLLPISAIQLLLLRRQSWMHVGSWAALLYSGLSVKPDESENPAGRASCLLGNGKHDFSLETY